VKITNNVITIKTEIHLPQTQVILADFGYLVNNWPECSQINPLE